MGKKHLIHELSPVEALLFLNFNGQELAETKSDKKGDYLAAALAYLGFRDYVRPIEGEQDQLELVPGTEPQDLRPYEEGIIEGFQTGHPERSIRVIGEYSFKHDLIELGLLKFSRRCFGIGRKYSVHPHSIVTLYTLRELRKHIDESLGRDDDLSNEDFFMAHAFPSLGISSPYRKYASSIVQEDGALRNEARILASTQGMIENSMNPLF